MRGVLLSMGEMPSKVAVYAVLASGYVAFEMFVQGWRGVDTVEDVTFVVGYGGGGVLSAFTEIAPGSDQLAVSFYALVPFFIISVAHLTAGSLARLHK